MTVLVLGIGNVLLSDEGVGVRIVEAFERKYRVPDEVNVLDGGTSGMDLLSHITGVDTLIVADAVRSGKAPGTVVRLDGDAVPALLRSKVSPHQVGLADVLASAMLMGEEPKDLTLFGVEPETIDTAMNLSDVVSAQVERVADLVAEALSERGITVEAA